MLTLSVRLSQFFVLTLGLIGSGYAVHAQVKEIPQSERIHHGDLIEIDELGGFDFDWRGRLNPEGFLDGFSKVADPIFARCKTPEELAELVRVAYSSTLRDPRVQVRILDRSARPPAYFEGAIKNPAKLQIRRDVYLRELLVLAGGFTDRASGEVTVLRPENQSCENIPGEPTRIMKVRIADILSGDSAADLKILSGDLVNVQQVEPVYVIGGVGRPGKQAWREGATVSRVVASAGGVSNRGVSGSVSVFRREQAGSKVIEADLDAITAGKAADIEIKAHDIVDVPLKGNAKRTTPPVVADQLDQPDRKTLPVRVID